MKPHSIPSRLGGACKDAADGVTAVLIGGSLVPRNLCHSVSEPCGSASTSRQGFVDLLT